MVLDFRALQLFVVNCLLLLCFVDVSDVLVFLSFWLFSCFNNLEM